jgi:hypothetical protein
MALPSHHCQKIALQIGDSLTVGASHAGQEFEFGVPLLSSVDLPADYVAAASRYVFSFDSGPPPCDVVVTLHRLII